MTGHTRLNDTRLLYEFGGFLATRGGQSERLFSEPIPPIKRFFAFFFDRIIERGELVQAYGPTAFQLVQKFAKEK